jgi:hypothetical protein
MGNRNTAPAPERKSLDALEERLGELLNKLKEIHTRGHDAGKDEYTEVVSTSDDILDAFRNATTEAFLNGPRKTRKTRILFLLAQYQGAVEDAGNSEDLRELHPLIERERNRVYEHSDPLAMAATKDYPHTLLF